MGPRGRLARERLRRWPAPPPLPVLGLRALGGPDAEPGLVVVRPQFPQEEGEAGMRTGLRGTLVIDERSPEGELPFPPPLPFFLLCLFLGTLFSQADRLLLRAQDWSWGSGGQRFLCGEGVDVP